MDSSHSETDSDSSDVSPDAVDALSNEMDLYLKDRDGAVAT